MPDAAVRDPADVDAILKRAYVARRWGFRGAARRGYAKAVALLRGRDAPLRLAHAVRHLGDVHLEAGRPDLAEPCYQEALSIYHARPDAIPLDVANALRSLAILQETVGDLEEALRVWEEVRARYAALDAAAGVEECARHVADIKRRAPQGS